MGRTKWPATYTRYFALGTQLSLALQLLFSFHLGCGYARKKVSKKNHKLNLMKYDCLHAKIVSLAIDKSCVNFVDSKMFGPCSHCSLVLSLSACNVGTSMITGSRCTVKLE